MENEWCSYVDGSQKGVAKVLDEGERYLVVKYSEGQGYNPSGILKENAKRFSKLELAIEDHIKSLSNQELVELGNNLDELRGIIRGDFPSYFRNKESSTST